MARACCGSGAREWFAALTGSLMALLIAGTFAAVADSASEEAIAIEEAWARPMPTGRELGAGYVTLRNAGDIADRLVAASTPRAERTELHETTVIDDVMRMRPLDGGIEIEPGGSIEMAPGGLHIMFLGVAEPFSAGERIELRLEFEQAGERTVVLEVRARPNGDSHHGNTHGDADHGHAHGEEGDHAH